MTDLNLTGQATSASQIQTRITQFKSAIDLRKDVWNRMSDTKKKAWVQSGKDPIMTIAWQIYRYLRDNFFKGEN